MITGFNTNVRHRGRVFHVQTEDSGRAHPHLITHVYCGGTILASEKTSYAERLDAPDLNRAVRALMEAQHKRMLARLEHGEFDAVIAERLDGVGAARAHTQPEGPPPAPRPERARTDPARGASTQPRLVPTSPPAAPVAQATAPAPPLAPAARRSFGDGVVSEKSLDTLILDFLVDKARGSRRSG